MRILIGCDERSSADRLYFDLKRAGLPKTVEVDVLSVTDIFLPLNFKPTKVKGSFHDVYLQQVDQEIKKAHQLADRVAKKLKSRFPHWHLHGEAAGGSPAQEIVKKAKEWNADLIVVGSHGRTTVGELFFGSVALKVLAESPCSVRIVRQNAEEIDSPSRVVIGVDGSTQSDAAIDVIKARHWKKGSAVHLVTAINAVMYSSFISDVYQVDTIVSVVTFPDDSSIKKEWRTKGEKKPMAWIKRMHQEYKSKLQHAGLIVSSFIEDGDPKVTLLKEAKRWGADSIMLGASGHRRMEGYLVGSVSSAVAARAHCSVEIIRRGKIDA